MTAPSSASLRRLDWVPVEAPRSAPLSADSAWLVIGDPDVGGPFSSALRALGVRAILATSGGEFTRAAGEAFRLDLTSAEHFRRLFSELPDHRWGGVLHLGGVLPEDAAAIPDRATLRAALSAGPASLLALLPSLLERRVPLWAMSAGAVVTGRERGKTVPLAAPFLATARTLLEEHPALCGGCLDLDALAPLLVGGCLEALAHRTATPLALRDELLSPRVVDVPGESRALPGRVFLVLGGAGALGAAMARRLAARDGASVILAGRGEEASAHSLLEELKQLGARARYVAQDVTDGEGLTRLVREVLSEERRLDGVVHAAGLIRPGSLARASWASFEQVLAPKVQGTLALAAALEEVPGCWVALLSSVAGSLPSMSRGLGSYAAANAFLDAFASAQRARGLPWSSVALAAVGGVGMSARFADSADQRALAIPTLALEQALGGIDAAVASGAGHLLVLPGDSRPERAPAQSSEPASTTLTSVALEPLLRRLLAEAIGKTPEEVDPHQSFQSLGIDSLDALDLLRALEEETGRTFPDTLLFEHDTVAKLVAELTRAAPAPAPPMPGEPAPRTPEEFPVIGAQKTFYANQQFYPDMPCYVFLRVDLRGAIDEQALERGVAHLFARHPMLGVSFHLREGALVQRRGDFGPPPLERVDLTSDREDAQRVRLEAVEAAFRNRTFGLEQGPLFRVALCRTGAERASLLFNVHHIVADAWSAQSLVTELLSLHQQAREGRPLELPPLRSTFAACVEAIEASGRSSAADGARAFWRRVLADPPPRLSLPYDGDPDGLPHGPCGLHQVLLDEETTSRLAERAREWNVSPFQLVFTAYLLSLRRWSGQEDLLVRVAHGRREVRVADIERVVGCFADSLPIRVKADGALGWRALAERVREASLEAQRHGNISSLELAGLGAARGPTGPRGVTPAGLSFPSFAAPERFGGLEIESVRAGAASGFTQLGLIAWELRGALHFSWNFTEALFRPATIQRLAGEYLEVLRELAGAEQAAKPSTAPGLDGRLGGALARSLPSGDVVHERIRARMQRSPERLAVCGGGQLLRYGELERRMDALGRSLFEEGARPGRLVGLLARPGPDAVTGVLGVLASGAAYVPIDPDYPDARVRQLAEHAGVELLVTTQDQLARLERMGEWAGKLGRVLLLDDGASRALAVKTWAETRDCAGAAPTGAGPDDLAYVMYTSGTTGRAKGVCVTHRAVSLFHDWVHEAFGVSSEDRFIQTSSLSFGGSIRQIYSPLLAGAVVYPAPPGLTRDPAALVEFLERERITLWNSVPTLWRRLLESVEALDGEGRRCELEALRWILIGGEQVPADLVRSWRRRFGARHRLANLYGSTETIVNATWFEVPRDFPADALHVPIGRERAGSRVRILDEARRPVLPGEVGELYVGGPSLSSGYHRAPELTREAFVEVPGEEGRFYRTGDLAREDAAGDLVYLGRADTQVKVRGNRVELSEIEVTLEAAPEVKAAAVVEHREGERQSLVAFVQPRGTWRVIDVQALRERVAARLPAFMVPHRIDVLAELPLSAAGKIDRAKLKELAARRLDERVTAPVRTQTERILAEVWCEVLRLPSVGVDQDFFSLGGDSLLALDMLARLKGRVAALPRPVTLYSERTIERLARAIDALARPPDSSGASTDAGEDAFSLAPSQSGFLRAERVRKGASPVWCADVPVRGRIDPRHFERALALAARRHPMLRAVFEARGIKTLQRIVEDLPVPIKWVDLRGLSVEEQSARADALFEEAKEGAFELERGPLWRIRVLRLAEEEWRWIVAVHHAIGDGWSVHLFAADLLALYDGLVGGEAPSLPPIAGSFREVVAYHQAQSARDHEQGRRFWTSRFAQPWPGARLPPAASGTGRRDALASSALTEEETQSLRARARRDRTSLHALALTAFFRVLREGTGQSDLVVGTAMSGRDLPVADVTRLFGCFAAALPVRATVRGGRFEEDLSAVSDAFGSATAHADVPIEVIARALRTEGTGPLPGASFFFSFMDFRSLPEVRARGLSLDWISARYHFAAQATGTELMVGALCQERLRINVHGSAPAPLRQRLAEALVEELRSTLVERPVEQVRSVARIEGPLDAALVAYLPAAESLARMLGTDSPEVLSRLIRQTLFAEGRPRLLEAIRTRLGRSGVVFVPHFADGLESLGGERVAGIVAEAVRLAEAHGARCVSLAGMLPSWTGYGFEVERALGTGRSRPAALTTGHGATVVAVVKTVEWMLRRLSLSLSDLDVAIVGFGSIGQASLRLLMDVAGLPRSVTVCDRPGQLERLGTAIEALQTRLGAPARISESGRRLAESAYQAHLIIGASSAGDVLEVPRLLPGTLVVDDSLPSISNVHEAWHRMRRGRDVVLAAGGLLHLGEAARELDEDLRLAGRTPGALAAFLSEAIQGCRAESLLLAAGQSLTPIRGLVNPTSALAWWRAARALGVGPAPLQLGGELIGSGVLEEAGARLKERVHG